MPKKNYNNRAMATDVEVRPELFFFPKANPPVTVRAANQVEAEAMVKSITRKEVTK